jgi:alanyl aminopeptidase
MTMRFLLPGLLGLALLAACSDSSKSTNPEPAAETAVDTAAAQVINPTEPPPARLPAIAEPTHYTLQLHIDPRQERFSGYTEIAVTLAQTTDSLWLHGDDLAVSQASAILPNGEVRELEWQQSTPYGVAKLTASAPLPAGELTLTFRYDAPFNTNLEGLHTVEQGGEKYAFTQFEATSARLAFPSFDEPAFKVPFDVELTVPADYTGIANTPQIAEQSNAEGFKTLTFATTKPLPTYLIAFAVGPFDVVEWEPVPASELRATPLPLRGITTRGKGEQIRYALENTAAIVLEMEDYFGAPHPYAKLDLIAVPDFSAGAMENAGAITYREQLILLDENASVRNKRSFFVTHAHELAHQWFGNLVTPMWWDDIWLNESFATWNAYIILDALYPDQNYRDSLQNNAASVMDNDSLASARQIREPITRHEDIGSAFNGITYRKGGGVLSMFEAFLGRDKFRDGIRQYMKTHAWGNTTAHDFIGAIADANPQVNGDDLRAAFMSYIEQPGMPVLSATLNCSDNLPTLTLQQQRYLPAGSTGSSDQTWVIPACFSLFVDGEVSNQCELISGAEQRLQLNNETCPQAVLPNTGGASYYRWALPPAQWQALLENFDSLNTSEQISVANSLKAALDSGSITLPDFLQSAATITASSSWRVALAPRDPVYKLIKHGSNPEDAAALRQLLGDWYRPQLNALNALPELTQDQQQFRMLMMSTLAMGAEDAQMRADLTAIAKQYTGYDSDKQLHPEAVDANMVYISLLAAINELGKPFADHLWQLFLASDNAQVREDLLLALGESADTDVAAAMRERILSPELMDNEIFYIYYNQMDRPEHQQALWQWTRDNLDAVLARIPAWRKGHVPNLFRDFCSTGAADELEAAFAPMIDTLESGPRYLANSLETIRLCASFVDLHGSKD